MPPTPPALLRRSLALLAALALWLAAPCRGADYGETLRSGKLWLMSPAELWEAFFRLEKDVYSIHEDTLLTERDTKPTDRLEQLRRPLPRSFWFWAPATTPRQWAESWNLARQETTPQRLLLLGKCKQMRVRRVSAMLFRAGSDKKEDAPLRLKAYTEQLNTWSGRTGQGQAEWVDAAGRSVSTLTWELPNCAIMLESATVKDEPDYIRLTFAPNMEDLYYRRTTSDRAASLPLLQKRVLQDEFGARLSGVPTFTHLGISGSQSYAPGWFEALCYYGYHDIDNYSSRRPKNKYPGKYTERTLRKEQDSQRLYSKFIRTHRKEDNLKFIEKPVAEEVYVLDRHVEKSDDWWDKLTKCLNNGIPVIYGGEKDGHIITAYREKLGERIAVSSLHGEMSAERCYMQPNAVYIILPAAADDDFDDSLPDDEP